MEANRLRIQIENELRRYTKTERGLRQGWVISPNLFKLYSETGLREIDFLPDMEMRAC